MKKENDIRVEMFRVVDDLNPFIKVDYVDRDAEEHTGLMMLDSGSNVNVLTGNVGRHIGDLCRHDNTELEITDSIGEVILADSMHFSFAFGGKLFNEDFCIREDCHIGHVDKLPIIGLLGTEFLQKYGLVIDFNDFTLHTSTISHTNFCASDCDFIFPMEVGLMNYGIPVLAIHHENTDAVALADTGSTANVVSVACINKCDLKCEYTNETYTIRGLKGRSEGNWANVDFHLLTLKENGVESLPFHDSFMVINRPVVEGFVFSESEQQPIEGAIGSPFMAKQGWTLDFAQKVIYKRKCQTV